MRGDGGSRSEASFPNAEGATRRGQGTRAVTWGREFPGAPRWCPATLWTGQPRRFPQPGHASLLNQPMAAMPHPHSSGKVHLNSTFVVNFRINIIFETVSQGTHPTGSPSESPASDRARARCKPREANAALFS